MREVYNSLEELMSSCANSELKSLVSSVLACSKYISWGFVSAVSDRDECRSDFNSPTDSSALVYRLSWKVNAVGQYAHIYIGEEAE